MRSILSFFIFLVASPLLIAQTAIRTVKVSAQEFVELESTEATYTIEIFNHRDQLRSYMDEDYLEEEYFEGDYYRDVEEGGMSEEEYQKKMNEHYAKIEQEKEERRSKFVPFKYTDLMAILDKNKLSYTTQTLLSPYRFDYEDSEKMITIVFVKLKHSKEYDRMIELLIDEPVQFVLTGVEFESPEKYLETIIPNLTAKAKEEAELLAKSLGKSLGDIIECTSDMPINQIRSNHYGNHRDGYSRELESNPFERKQVGTIKYDYVFELLSK